jgi:hypothetical protein
MLVSREIQIGFPCPHLIIEEVVALGDDNRSLTTRAAVASTNSVRIMVNNEVYVPPAGLYSFAELQGSRGPYRIEKCVGTGGPDGNLLVVTASGGTVNIDLPTSQRISAKKLLRLLKLSALNNLVTLKVVNGAITLVDNNNVGGESFVRVSGDGATALGFHQRGARGTMLYPGWTLASQPDVFPSAAPVGMIPVAARYPRFKKPVPKAADFKVTYVAMPERCPRCQATYIENDYRFDSTGAVRTIVNEDLLYQACLKAVLTEKGSNPYHTGYGSSIASRVGRKRMSSTATTLREDVILALQGVQGIQDGQRKFQQVTNRERLYRIEDVTVKPSGDDPTTLFVGMAVTNGSNKPISLNIVYSAPGAIALAGSNGLTLGASGMSKEQAQRFLLDG